MINGLKPAQRISLSDNIVEQLTGLIAREVLKPGERIPSEKQLCQEFGVGRTSVREALKSLSVMEFWSRMPGMERSFLPTATDISSAPSNGDCSSTVRW